MNALRDSNAVHGLDREINEFLEDFVGFQEKSVNVLGTLKIFDTLYPEFNEPYKGFDLFSGRAH